jgi:DNA-binding PadR family transcriptional regulator
LRHTWGYQEYGIKKHITIEEFVNGRRRQDGTRMDRGTGLSERAVYDGLRKAVANGLVDEETDDTDRGRVKKFYSLRMRPNATPDEAPQTLQSGVQSLHPDLQRSQGRGAESALRTEKDTLERNLGISNFERSHDNLEENVRRRSGRQARGEPTQASLIQSATTVTGMQSLREVVERRASQVTAVPRRKGRPPGNVEEREHVAAFLTDFAAELGDEAPLASTITRTLNIFKATGLPPERWGDALYQARSRTQEHTAQIRKTAGDGGSGLRRKNKIPYFLATLEQIVGLRRSHPAEHTS